MTPVLIVFAGITLGHQFNAMNILIECTKQYSGSSLDLDPHDFLTASAEKNRCLTEVIFNAQFLLIFPCQWINYLSLCQTALWKYWQCKFNNNKKIVCALKEEGVIRRQNSSCLHELAQNSRNTCVFTHMQKECFSGGLTCDMSPLTSSYSQSLSVGWSSRTPRFFPLQQLCSLRSNSII